MEEAVKPLFAGNGREGKLLQCCLPDPGFLLYIVKEVEAIGQLNQQTTRIILMCNQVLMLCNQSHPRTSALIDLDYEAVMSALWVANSPARAQGRVRLASDPDREMD
jgi:hypothetical protein